VSGVIFCAKARLPPKPLNHIEWLDIDALPLTVELAKVIGALDVDLASGHLNSSGKAPGSRRWKENGKVERLGCRLRRRNDSSIKSCAN